MEQVVVPSGEAGQIERTAGDHPSIGGNRRRGINADMVSSLQGPSGDLGIDLVRPNQPRVRRDGEAFLQ